MLALRALRWVAGLMPCSAHRYRQVIISASAFQLADTHAGSDIALDAAAIFADRIFRCAFAIQTPLAFGHRLLG